MVNGEVCIGLFSLRDIKKVNPWTIHVNLFIYAFVATAFSFLGSIPGWGRSVVWYSCFPLARFLALSRLSDLEFFCIVNRLAFLVTFCMAG